MTTQDYMPKADDKLSVWANNFGEKLPSVKATLQLQDEDVSEMRVSCQSIQSAITASNAAKATAQQATANKDLQVDKNQKALRKQISAIKTNKAYTEAIGKVLGIVGVSTEVDMHTYKPSVEALLFPGHVTIRFTKKGVDGVNVYARMQGETTWQKLAYDSHSPYQDNRPLAVPGVPENREYICIGVIHDEQIGQASDVISVVFGG